VLAIVRSGSDPLERAPDRRSSNCWPSRRQIATISACAVASVAIAGAVARGPISGARDDGGNAVGLHGARASLRRVGADAELQVSGMPQPPPGEVYEVWLESGAARPRATDALFGVTSSGSAAVDVPGSLRGVREVMVSAEPLGGSASPTSAAVLRVKLAHGL
jgi:anti-sigma-K factor RskA